MDLQTCSFQPEFTSAANQYWISAYTLLSFGWDGMVPAHNPSSHPLQPNSMIQFPVSQYRELSRFPDVSVFVELCSRTERRRQELLHDLQEKMRNRKEGNQGSAYGLLGYLALANQRPPLNLFPWVRTDKYFHQNLRDLSEEIRDFVKYIQPTYEEKMVRQRVVDRVTRLIEEIWPDCEHTVFGSFKTDLFLPTSDIDLAITGRLPNEPYVVLQRALESSNMASSIKVISTASVPLVKMTDRETQIRVDISFNVANTQESASLIVKHLEVNPGLKPLILVLKQFLLQRDLNEVYSGGISSYSLILMCIAFTLNVTAEGRTHPEMMSCGQLLVEFFEFYGRHFNFTKCTISINAPGGVMNRREFMKQSKYNPTSYMSIEDPLDPENDIARNSFGASNVRDAFAQAYATLSSAVLSVYDEVHNTIIELNRRPLYNQPFSSILARILCVTQEMQTYRQWIADNFRGGIYYPSIESSLKQRTCSDNNASSSGGSTSLKRRQPTLATGISERQLHPVITPSTVLVNSPHSESVLQSDGIPENRTDLNTPTSSGTDFEDNILHRTKETEHSVTLSKRMDVQSELGSNSDGFPQCKTIDDGKSSALIPEKHKLGENGTPLPHSGSSAAFAAINRGNRQSEIHVPTFTCSSSRASYASSSSPDRPEHREKPSFCEVAEAKTKGIKRPPNSAVNATKSCPYNMKREQNSSRLSQRKNSPLTNHSDVSTKHRSNHKRSSGTGTVDSSKQLIPSSRDDANQKVRSHCNNQNHSHH